MSDSSCFKKFQIIIQTSYQEDNLKPIWENGEEQNGQASLEVLLRKPKKKLNSKIKSIHTATCVGTNSRTSIICKINN